MSDDGAKEWVTIKIPEDIRDDARDDPRTYGEIMEAGLDGDTPGPKSYLEPDVNIAPDVLAEALSESLGDVDAELPDDIREQLDRIEAAATTTESRTLQIENVLEELHR